MGPGSTGIIFENHFWCHSFVPGLFYTLVSNRHWFLQANWSGVPLALMNAHLESCKEGAGERQTQMRYCFQRVTAQPPQRVAIFGGDLNAREPDVSFYQILLLLYFEIWFSWKIIFFLFISRSLRSFLFLKNAKLLKTFWKIRKSFSEYFLRIQKFETFWKKFWKFFENFEKSFENFLKILKKFREFFENFEKVSKIF